MIKIDTTKVEYDGNSIKLIVPDEEAFMRRLIEKQKAIVADLERQEQDADVLTPTELEKVEK